MSLRIAPLALALLASAAYAQPAPAPPAVYGAASPGDLFATGGEEVAPVARWAYGFVRAVAFAEDVPVTAEGSVIRTLAPEASGGFSVRGEVTLDGVVSDMAAEGSTVVVATTHFERESTGIFVIDVSDPDAPVVRGSLLGLSATALAVRDGIAYVSTFEVEDAPVLSFRVISLADLDAPAELGAVSTDSFAEDIAVSGDRAYLALGVVGLAEVDISTPEAPALTGGAVSTAFAAAAAVDAAGETLAAVERSASGAELRFYDLTGDGAPALSGSVALRGTGSAFGLLPLDALWDGDQVAVGLGFDGLQFVDAADPAAPGVPRRVSTRAAFIADGTSRLAARDGELIAADVYSGTVRVDAAARAVSGRLVSAGIALDVTADESGVRAYVASGGAGLVVLGRDADGALTEVARYHTPQWNYTSGVALAEGYAYAADSFAGIWPVEIATGQIGTAVTSTSAIRRVASGAGRLVGFDDGGNALVYDLADPAAPVLTATIRPDGGAADAVSTEGALYVSESNTGTVYVYDPANLDAPAATVSARGFGLRLALDGDRLYALGNGLITTVYDISDPLAPAEVGSLQFTVRQEAIAARRDVLAVVGLGVATYRTTDPANAELIGGSVAFGDTQTGLAFVSARRFLVSANQAGVYLVSTPPAVSGEAAPEARALAVSAAPNPSAGAPALAVRTPEPARVEVFDALGRRVRAWRVAAGETRTAWEGAALAPGVYLARVRTASGETTAARFTVAR